MVKGDKENNIQKRLGENDGKVQLERKEQNFRSI